MGITSSHNREVYHERQCLEYCGLHCLNNLFQQKNAFTRAGLNEIGERIKLEEPERSRTLLLCCFFKTDHYNVFTGNYDANVLISALEEKGKIVVWHNRRNEASSIDLDGAESENLMGIVVNFSSRKRRSGHWSAVKKINGVWYDLDSYFRAPEAFRDTNHVRVFLDNIIGNGGDILLVKNNIQEQS